MTSTDAVRARLGELFKAVDAQDTERFLSFLTEGARFRFGSAAAAEGQDAVRAAVGGFFASIAGCRHVLTRTIAESDAIICEGEVTYTRHDGSQLTIPFANFLELDGELISDYKIYADAAALYA